MLRIDLNDYMISNENRGSAIKTQDDRYEWQLLRVIAKRLNIQNHQVQIREGDATVKERAEYLMGGRSDELSVALRLHNKPQGGFFISMSPRARGADKLLSDLCRKYLSLIPDIIDYTEEEAERIPELITFCGPTIDRPARVEISIASVASEDWTYWLAPPRLVLYAQLLSKAFNEFDDLYNGVEHQGENRHPLLKPEVTPEPLVESEDHDSEPIAEPSATKAACTAGKVTQRPLVLLKKGRRA
jgi:hypothetical protein